MNKAANTYWADARLATQRPVARTLSLSSAHASSHDIFGTRTETRRVESVPPWVIFSMIILATFACCITVTMRTHAEMRAAEQKYQQISADVELLRSANASLERRAQRLRTDRQAIEAAARTELGMVRADEVIVPVESSSAAVADNR
ncbi:MAG: septum formation initiator family protein [Pyrinomonadaceae bacterium]|nr:septum formation initiator family protein [Pyrinomonadaceae bacterium]